MLTQSGMARKKGIMHVGVPSTASFFGGEFVDGLGGVQSAPLGERRSYGFGGALAAQESKQQGRGEEGARDVEEKEVMRRSQSRWSVASSVVLTDHLPSPGGLGVDGQHGSGSFVVSGRDAGAASLSTSTSTSSFGFAMRPPPNPFAARQSQGPTDSFFFDDDDGDVLALASGSVGGMMATTSPSSRRIKGWGRKSKDGKEREDAAKSKSAPSSPKRERRKSGFGRSTDREGDDPAVVGGKRRRLANFLAKISGGGGGSAGGSGSASGASIGAMKNGHASTASTLSSTSSASGSSPARHHQRAAMGSVVNAATMLSEPDLRRVDGSWEALHDGEVVPPVPPVPPLHTLPRMTSKSSLGRGSAAAAASSPALTSGKTRRATIVSSASGYEEEDVPPTPSSYLSGASSAGSGNGILRPSRSVSNLNAGASGWATTPVSPSFPPGVTEGESNQDAGAHESGWVSSPGWNSQFSHGEEKAGRESMSSNATSVAPPVPPKDGAMYQWPSAASMPPPQHAVVQAQSPPSSAGGASPRTSFKVRSQVAGQQDEKSRDRGVTRLRLKSSPSLGNLHQGREQHGTGEKSSGKLRSFAARIGMRGSGA